MFVPRHRRKIHAWIRNWLATTYPGETKLPLNQVRDEMYWDLPQSFIPPSVNRQWFDKQVLDAVRQTHWALTTSGSAKQLEFLFDMPLNDVIHYEVGKAQRAQTDVAAIRHDLEAYQAATGQRFDIDRTMRYIMQAAGL